MEKDFLEFKINTRNLLSQTKKPAIVRIVLKQLVRSDLFELGAMIVASLFTATNVKPLTS